jgi:hypothetical protein
VIAVGVIMKKETVEACDGSHGLQLESVVKCRGSKGIQGRGLQLWWPAINCKVKKEKYKVKRKRNKTKQNK